MDFDNDDTDTIPDGWEYMDDNGKLEYIKTKIINKESERRNKLHDRSEIKSEKEFSKYKKCQDSK